MLRLAPARSLGSCSTHGYGDYVSYTQWHLSDEMGYAMGTQNATNTKTESECHFVDCKAPTGLVGGK